MNNFRRVKLRCGPLTLNFYTLNHERRTTALLSGCERSELKNPATAGLTTQRVVTLLTVLGPLVKLTTGFRHSLFVFLANRCLLYIVQ